MMNITKARHNLLARFAALKHDTRTGGELTVRINPQPSKLVKMPDPYSDQDTIHALCQTVHALQTRLATLEQGQFATTGQPASLTVTVLGERAPVPTAAQPRGHSNVRPCPLVQADTGSYGNAQHGSRCPLVSDYSGSW